MKLQCDVCERAPATVICCADEAALCPKCDVEIHGANKLASKHQRLLLQCLSDKLPPCDICREKVAFIFCVEDRALFCKDCDEPIHSASSLSAKHQRFLATGIKVALSSSCSKGSELNGCQPPSQNAPSVPMKALPQQAPDLVSAWGVDDLLQLSNAESSEKKDQLQFGELEWLADTGLLDEQIAEEALSAAEVPEIPISTASYSTPYRSTRISVPQKKPRVELPDDEEHFTVPDLG